MNIIDSLIPPVILVSGCFFLGHDSLMINGHFCHIKSKSTLVLAFPKLTQPSTQRIPSFPVQRCSSQNKINVLKRPNFKNSRIIRFLNQFITK